MKENRLNVFLVDDEEAIVSWLTKNVDWENYGCKVIGFATKGVEALSFITHNNVDVLITDIQMPDMSGLELIKNAKIVKPDLYIIVLSAYDKFEYVKEAFRFGIIDYFLKPIDVNEIYNCLKTVEMSSKEAQISSKKLDINIFRNSIFQRIISGEDDSIRLMEQCKLANIDLYLPVCQIALIDVMQMEKRKCTSLLALCNEYTSKEMYVFLDGHMNIVLLFFGDENSVNEKISKVSSALCAKNMLRESFFVVGKPLQTYRELAESYTVCYNLSAASTLFESSIIDSSQYPYEKYLKISRGGSRQRLLNQLQSEDFESIMQVARKTVSACHTDCEMRNELICFMVFLINNLSVLEPLKKVNLPDGKFSSLSSSKQMLEWMEQFFKNIKADIHCGGEEVFYHQHVYRALREIGLHYADSTFSIQDVAKNCHVSSAYLGKIFREQTGESFNDYLLKVRMLKAEKLLFDNVLRIADVAEKVGFSNQSYFNKMFRKVYGVSPREYRYRCQED